MKKITTLLNKIPALTVGTVSVGSFTIAANNVKESTISVAKSGHTPVGIMGFNVEGSGVSYCAPYHLYLSGNTAYYAFRNNSNGQVSVTNLRLLVLYAKLGGGSQ